MKFRRLNKVIFFAVTLIVFGAGTAFTFLHRFNPDAGIGKENILAVAAALFLTVGEMALILVHALIDDRALWRRIAAYTMGLVLIGTITYAAGSEAYNYMEEGNMRFKTGAVTDLSKGQLAEVKGRAAQAKAISEGQKLMKETLEGMASANFTPFAVNFFVGLFCILTATLVQPREPWKRRKGNVMDDEVRNKVKRQLGFTPPTGATAYDDGKGSSIIVKAGRRYLGTIKREDRE